MGEDRMRIRHWIYAGLAAIVVFTHFLSVYFAVQAFQSKAALGSNHNFASATYHFVLIPEEMDNPYWQKIKKGAKAAADEMDAVIEYSGPIQSDTKKHKQMIEKATASKVDGIITQGLSKATTPSINKAIQHGIPVVTVDSDAPDSRREAYVGTDNYAAGKKAAQTLIQDIDGPANVGIITGSRDAANQKLRVQGFRDAVGDEADIQIAAVKSSHISKVRAAKTAYEMFLKHPDINAYFGTSALDGLGISAAMQSVGQVEDTYILAFDQLPQTSQLIKKGRIDATIAQRPYEMGYQSVEKMVKQKQGEPVQKVTSTGIKVIHRSDLGRGDS